MSLDDPLFAAHRGDEVVAVYPQPECAQCGDTGNVPGTGFRHPAYDELGCIFCDSEAKCCRAEPTEATRDDPEPTCRGCGHYLEREP